MISSISDCVTRICQRRCQRREAGPSVILPVSDDDLDELLEFVAAEANHEPNQRSQLRLDVAFDALTNAQMNLHCK